MDGLGSFGTSPLHYRAYQNFGYRDFAICEGKVSCLLSFPDAETPKRRPAATCPFDGRRRPSAKINGHDLFGMINGHDQIPAFLNLIHILRHFGVSVIGISRLAKTRVLVLSFSRVPKRRSAYQQPRILPQMDGPRCFTISRLATPSDTNPLSTRIPGIRNTDGLSISATCPSWMDGLDLYRDFHHGVSRSLVIRTPGIPNPESPIPTPLSGLSPLFTRA
jgi:hypothetical protein